MEDVRPMEVNGRKYFGRVAKITSANLSIEDHGILTVWIMLDYGGGGQGFGGFALDEWYQPWNRRRGTAMGTDFLLRLFKAFKVPSLDALEDRYCYALTDDDRHSSSIKGLLTMPMDGGDAFLIADWLKDWGVS